MSHTWTELDRESAYTRLCEAVTAAGEARETQFLARLCLLLSEELGDPAAFARALSGATLDAPALVRDTITPS